MNYNNPIPQKTVGIIRYSCGFLFLAFCFCYLFFLQGDVLAEVQFVLSNGLTSYSIVGGALIITLVLVLMQWVVSLVVRMPNKFYALTYVPSFLALAMLSDMDQNLEGDFIWGMWKWLLPLILVLWLISVFVIKSSDDTDSNFSRSFPALLWPNYLVMLVMVCLCGFVPKTKDCQQYELRVERLLEAKDYEEAAAVATKSLIASPRLTQMRMYALLKQGLLADSMFSYPQIHGTKGLLDISDTVRNCRFGTRNIEAALGHYAGKGIRTSKRYLEILKADSLATDNSKQYMLCYYLLEKNLDDFNAYLHKVYGDTITAELPRYYQEADIIQHPEYRVDSLPIYINKVYVERYQAYQAMKDTIADDVERRNYTRRNYGDTYYWYFEN